MKLFYTKTYNAIGENIQKQDIIAEVAKKMGFDEISFFKYPDKVDSDRELNTRMESIISAVENDSIVFFQYPSMVSTRYDTCFVKHIKKKKNVALIIWIEDLKSVIDVDSYADINDEIQLFNEADLLILQSVEMRDYLIQEGMKDIPYCIQKIWEFPYGFLKKNIIINKDFYFAKKLSVERMCEITTVGIGMVESINDTYDKIINPLPIGFYICAGIPVMVHGKTNVSRLVTKYGIGFVMSDSETADEVLNRISDEDITKAVEQEKKLAPAVADGVFTKLILQEAMYIIVDKKCQIYKEK